MAALSFVLAILSMIFTFGAIVGAGLEWVGVTSALLAVASSIGGIVTGAVAHSRAKSEGRDSTFAVVGIVSNVFTFLGALCIGGSCGACNYLVSTNGMTRTQYIQGPDGGVIAVVTYPDGAVRYEDLPPGAMGGLGPAPDDFAPKDAGVDPAAPPVPVPVAPAAPTDPLAPPPAYPPPPIDPGTR